MTSQNKGPLLSKRSLLAGLAAGALETFLAPKGLLANETTTEEELVKEYTNKLKEGYKEFKKITFCRIDNENLEEEDPNDTNILNNIEDEIDSLLDERSSPFLTYQSSPGTEKLIYPFSGNNFKYDKKEMWVESILSLAIYHGKQIPGQNGLNDNAHMWSLYKQKKMQIELLPSFFSSTEKITKLFLQIKKPTSVRYVRLLKKYYKVVANENPENTCPVS